MFYVVFESVIARVTSGSFIVVGIFLKNIWSRGIKKYISII